MGRTDVIINRTRGVDAGKALAYDYGPGKRMEHHNPRRVAGSLAGRDWRARARTMQAKLRADGDHGPGKRGRVIRLAVSAAPGDRVMSDREWSDIARRVVGEFTKDADSYTWEAVRHDPRHIHITLLQRNDDGKLLSESHDQYRYGRISEGLERDYQLQRVDHSRTDTPERKRARTEGRRRAAAQQRTKTDRPRPVQPLPEQTTPTPAAPSRETPPPLRAPKGGKEPGEGRIGQWRADRLGPKPDDWDRWTPQRQGEHVRARLAEYRRKRRGDSSRDRDGGPRGQPARESGPQPRHQRRDNDRGVQEPGEGRIGQWRADRLGPKPDDWDRWTPQRQGEHVRARMAEYQRRQREERRRGRGRGDDKGRGRDDDR